jgi:hypothetical protein
MKIFFYILFEYSHLEGKMFSYDWMKTGAEVDFVVSIKYYRAIIHFIMQRNEKKNTAFSGKK